MKIAALVSRFLLGLIFTVFGLNGFLHFIPMQMPPGVAGEFFGVLAKSGYLPLVFLIQLVCGILFLLGRFVPLALVLIGPIIVNILMFHSLMAPSGLPLALITALLWFVLFFWHRRAFAPLFSAHPAL